MSYESSPNEAEAITIYNTLQENRYKATLSGYMHGDVIYPAPILRRVRIARLNTSDDFEKEMYLGRGFTPLDLQSGLTAIIELEFLNPNWPRVPAVPEPHLRYYNVSGLGNVVYRGYEQPERTFSKSRLEPIHIDAFKTVTKLSMIPRQIVELFGSYDEFLRTLGNRYDPAGIDFSELTPTQGLYDGGLREFVRALELKSKGELYKLDTAQHALVNSLDERDHFTKLFEILENGEPKMKKPPLPPLFLLAV